MSPATNPTPSTIVPGQDQPGRNSAAKSVAEANEKHKVAQDKVKAADDAAATARASAYSPEWRAAFTAQKEADKASADARQAGFDIQQARANAVLEHKVGRKLKDGEFARWISGDHNNMREENVELCSPAILSLEAKTGRHVNAEEMLDYEMDYEHSAVARAFKEQQNRLKGE